MDLLTNQLTVDRDSRSGRKYSGLTCALLLAFCTGCGGSTNPSPDLAAAGTTTPSISQDPSTNPTAVGSATSDSNDSRSDSANVKHGRGEVWLDDKGQKWFGDVPMDAFFDQPYTVASNATPLGGDSAATAIVTNTSATNAADPAMSQTPEATTKTDTTSTVATGGSWDELISIQELDDEVKTIRNFLNENLQSVSNFNSSMLMIPPKAATLGALAGVAMEHPNAVSWKDDAIYIRDLAKQMNSDTLRSGPKDQKRLLALYESISDTLNRSRPAGLTEPPESDGFSEVSEMRLLMYRMDEAEKRMKTEAGTEGALASRKDMVAHEAALMATLAKIVTLPGYGYEDDAKFKDYANEITKSALAMKSAAESSDFGTYELALTKVSTTCSNCHSEYKNN